VDVDKKKKVEAEMPEGAKIAPRAPKRSCKCFKKPKSGKVSDVEMKKQIKEQQDKINSMDPEDLKRRRDKVKALQGKGEGLESLRDSNSQKIEREKFYQRQTDILTPLYGQEEAEKKVKEMMDGLDATHVLDIVAGGDPYDISGLQNRTVNRSMGNQWMKEGRLDDLDKAIDEAIGPPNKKMKFEMKMCD
jgi:hypothetical protein